MNEAYLLVNNKKIKLTDKQLKELGFKFDKTSIFKRLKEGGSYFSITDTGIIAEHIETNFQWDKNRHDVANYCTDKKLLEQRALHEILNRQLWQFSIINKADEIVFDDEYDLKWYIEYDYYLEEFEVIGSDSQKNAGTIYFKTREIACGAIQYVIEPFMKEHPEFEW